MAKTSLTLTHMDTGVRFHHPSDERGYFEWLGRIPCVESYSGDGQRGLVVHLKRKPRKDELRELLAFCHRYGVDKRQLAKFETAKNRSWFQDAIKYWYTDVFENAESAYPDFFALTALLEMIPGVAKPIATGLGADREWWVKFAIYVSDPLAWHVVQELGYVLNYISLTERLPTVFLPVSPPPYLNGGPTEFLSWVIECRDRRFPPEAIAKYLADRLPNPIAERSAWGIDD